jgi:thiamine-phosphate pyrophosphorylase
VRDGGVLGARLVAITDRRVMVAPELLAHGDVAVIAAAYRAAIARARVEVVPIREKDLDGGVLLVLVRAALATGARVIVNDRVDVALAAGAHGVHLPERGLAVAEVRRLAGPRFAIGCSRHSQESARAAFDEGADWVQLGPIYETPGKGAAIGVGALAGARADAGQLVAVGGIDSIERVKAAAGAGADAVAAIRVIWRDDFDPAAFAAAWL